MSYIDVPKKGDIVVYPCQGGELYFFQPAGNCCYLYKNRHDFGFKNLASKSPPQRLVRKATLLEIEKYVIYAESIPSPRDTIELLRETFGLTDPKKIDKDD